MSRYRQYLTLNLLTSTIVAPPSNANKWQIGFNSAFKGLIILNFIQCQHFIISFTCTSMLQCHVFYYFCSCVSLANFLSLLYILFCSCHVSYHICSCTSFAYVLYRLHIHFVSSQRSSYSVQGPSRLSYGRLLYKRALGRARTHTRTHMPCLLGGGRLPTRNLEDSTVKYSHYGENCSI